jgi:choline dehydrogenase-like flavoprotein
MEKEFDVVVVGSGPGGASAARDLCRAGKKVVMLEYGSDGQWLGNHFSVLNKVDLKNAIPLGHVMMLRGITTGGSSVIYCGTATPPAAFIKEQTGIDLMPYSDKFEEELRTAPLPDRLVGEAAQRIMDAANAIGFDWQLLPKFIDPDKCERDCGDCMLGCKTGAKWSSREFVKEALGMGMELRTRVRVDEVIEENGTALGVRGRGPGGLAEVRAEKVVIAAGGLGTPVILKRSGIAEAGQGYFSDPLIFTYGKLDGIKKGSIYDIPMTAGTWQFHEDEGFLMTDLAEPWMMLWSSMGFNMPPRIGQFHKVRKILGIMTKVKDPISGTIDEKGRLKKELEPEVKKRLQSGDEKARQILLKAGVKKSSLFTSPMKAAHPGGSAPIGKVVDNNLETQIKNCYVADASVVPDELGTPVLLLALCIGRYGAERILENWT